MDIEQLRNFCLKKAAVEESFPFNESTLVFKIAGKMFLLVDIESKPLSFNVKCKPERAIELREKHPFVKPGYHMNKVHWNTITVDETLPDSLLYEWINHSYELVLSSLSKKIQLQINLK
jgi:predicted DNA-binding protein (MmcQ/YjbR family)